jgi:hypothetical protein
VVKKMARGVSVVRKVRGFVSKLLPHAALALLVTTATVSCATSSSGPDGTSASAVNGSASASSAVATTGSATVSSSDPLPSASAARSAEADANRFADLVNDLSEPDTYFFSDNLISNETSYLQPAELLASRADPNGVYVGVGPEQNFTYIALTKPSMAFVVDIRRANMLLHLLYRAAFEEATDRAHFLALVLGRGTPEGSLATAAGIDEVVSAATKPESTKASFDAANGKLMKRIAGYGVKLGDEDTKAIKKMHATFHKEGIDLRFELHEQNGRLYPTLKELLVAKSPAGKTGSFLATEDSFRFLQTMQKAGKIVPVVGNFAGDHALPQLASYLKNDKRSVSTFYVSNVEQYLLEPKDWKKWTRNVKALPKTDEAVFVRAYLDQGRKHPSQLKGHRTASVLSKMSDFEAAFGDKPTATFFAISTEKVL